MKKSKKFLKVCKSLGLDPNTIPEIMSFEKACKMRKIKPVLPIVNHLPERHRARQIADYKLAIITEAFNLQPDGTVWEPNYNDDSEWKYEPRFWIDADAKNPSGFGLLGARTTMAGVRTRLPAPALLLKTQTTYGLHKRYTRNYF